MSEKEVATAHCMKCDKGFKYFNEEDIHDFCPDCGEHKEFCILFSEPEEEDLKIDLKAIYRFNKTTAFKIVGTHLLLIY